MKLIQLLLEIEFRTYEAMVQIRFKEEVDGGYDDAIRALPGVTTCTVASKDKESKKATYKIKIISQKESIEAFEAFKNNAISKYSEIIAVEVGKETIEEK